MYRQRGNTVLEMLIALFVITTGLFAIIGLSFGNAVQTKTSVNELQASNFAREGIEIVRNIRDSNKYKKLIGSDQSVRWNDGINQEKEYAIDTSSRTLIDKTTTPDTTAITFLSGTFVQGGSSGAPTKFHRIVRLSPICSLGSPRVDDLGSSPDSSCDFNSADTDTGSTIGVQAIVEVRWKEGSRPRKITVEDRLYNW